MEYGKVTAIILAAGQGKRMGSSVPKQYLKLEGHEILYYSVRAFEDCPAVDEIILVTGGREIEYCQKEIVEKYGFLKVSKIIPGRGRLSRWRSLKRSWREP